MYLSEGSKEGKDSMALCTVRAKPDRWTFSVLVQ